MTDQQCYDKLLKMYRQANPYHQQVPDNEAVAYEIAAMTIADPNARLASRGPVGRGYNHITAYNAKPVGKCINLSPALWRVGAVPRTTRCVLSAVKGVTYVFHSTRGHKLAELRTPDIPDGTVVEACPMKKYIYNTLQWVVYDLVAYKWVKLETKQPIIDARLDLARKVLPYSVWQPYSLTELNDVSHPCWAHIVHTETMRVLLIKAASTRTTRVTQEAYIWKRSAPHTLYYRDGLAFAAPIQQEDPSYILADILIQQVGTMTKTPTCPELQRMHCYACDINTNANGELTFEAYRESYASEPVDVVSELDMMVREPDPEIIEPLLFPKKRA